MAAAPPNNAVPALVPYDNDSGAPSEEACAAPACKAAAPATHMCGRCFRGAFCNAACQAAAPLHALVCVADDDGDGDDGDAFAKAFAAAVHANKTRLRALLRSVGRQGCYDLACGARLHVVTTRGAAAALLPADSAAVAARFPELPARVAATMLAAFPEFARAVHAVAASPAAAYEKAGTFKVAGAAYSGERFTLEVVAFKSGCLRATLCLTSED